MSRRLLGISKDLLDRLAGYSFPGNVRELENEIRRMVSDAEAHAEEDARFEELATLRNQGDALVHSARKMVADAGDKATDAEKQAIDSAAKELEQAIQGDDKSDIEAKIQALSQATGGLAQKMYAESAAGAGAAGAEAGDGSASGNDAVDAEFEEVDDSKKTR